MGGRRLMGSISAGLSNPASVRLPILYRKLSCFLDRTRHVGLLAVGLDIGRHRVKCDAIGTRPGEQSEALFSGAETYLYRQFGLESALEVVEEEEGASESETVEQRSGADDGRLGQQDRSSSRSETLSDLGITTTSRVSDAGPSDRLRHPPERRHNGVDNVQHTEHVIRPSYIWGLTGANESGALFRPLRKKRSLSSSRAVPGYANRKSARRNNRTDRRASSPEDHKEPRRGEPSNRLRLGCSAQELRQYLASTKRVKNLHLEPSDIAVVYTAGALTPLLVRRLEVKALNHAVGVLCKQKCWEEARGLISLMAECSQCNTHTFAAFFTCCGVHHRLDQATHARLGAPSEGGRAACRRHAAEETAEGVAARLAAVSAEAVAALEAWHKQRLEVGKAGMSAFLKAHITGKQPERLASALERLEHKRFELGAYVYATAINLLFNQGMFEECLTVYWNASQVRGRRCNTQIFDVALKACRKVGRPELVLDVCRAMREDGVDADVRLSVTLISTAADADMLPLATQLFDAAVGRVEAEAAAVSDPHPQDDSFDNPWVLLRMLFNTIMLAHARLGLLHICHGYYDRMLALDACRPDAYTFVAMLTAMARTPSHDPCTLPQLRQLLQDQRRFRVPCNQHLFACRLGALRNCTGVSDHERSQQAQAWLDEMQASGVKPNKVVYHNLIALHCDMLDMAHARQLFRQMQDQGVVPEHQTFKHLVACCWELGRTEEAEHFEELSRTLALLQTGKGDIRGTSNKLPEALRFDV